MLFLQNCCTCIDSFKCQSSGKVKNHVYTAQHYSTQTFFLKIVETFSNISFPCTNDIFLDQTEYQRNVWEKSAKCDKLIIMKPASNYSISRCMRGISKKSRLHLDQRPAKNYLRLATVNVSYKIDSLVK